MDISVLIQSLAVQFPIVLTIASILGTLVVVGQTIVVMTPSKSDDVAWEKIKSIPLLGSLISALANFAVLQKK